MGRHHDNQNQVPDGDSNINDMVRQVFIGNRAVGGAVVQGIFSGLGGIFGGPTGVLPNNGPPNPAYHWCVIVGDFYHQLQATSLDSGWNYYDNNKESGWDLWNKFHVGQTRFNDVSIRQACEKAMNDMPEVYNVYDNNCQTFVIKVLNLICMEGRQKVRTSYSLSKKQIAFVSDLDADKEGKEVEVAYAEDGLKHFELLAAAQDIMEEKTPLLTKEDVEADLAKTA